MAVLLRLDELQDLAERVLTVYGLASGHARRSIPLPVYRDLQALLERC